METLRTPAERFEGLPDWPFSPHFTEIDDLDGGRLRVHHVDEGPSDAAPVLCLHGEPSWSYLYRHMIPVFAAEGHRVVAPDLVGFGRSDKPVDQDDYTYARHVAWMTDWLEQLDLSDITLVCQDWGGLVGLRLATAMPERFSRLVVANTGLPTGDRPPPEAFLNWQRFSQDVEQFDSGVIISMGTTTDLSEQIVAAYNAPFPDDASTAGARRFPLLVPTTPDDPAAEANRDAWKVLEAWEKPLLTAFSDSDPITRGGERIFQQKVPGAAGRTHATIEGGGHFLQEDRGPELARVVIDLIEATPSNGAAG